MIILPTSLPLLLTSAEIPRNTFRDDQLRYERVRTAYAEKKKLSGRIFGRRPFLPARERSIFGSSNRKNSLELWAGPRRKGHRLVNLRGLHLAGKQRDPHRAPLGRSAGRRLPDPRGVLPGIGIQPGKQLLSFPSCQLPEPVRAGSLGVHKTLGRHFHSWIMCHHRLHPHSRREHQGTYLAAVEVRQWGRRRYPSRFSQPGLTTKEWRPWPTDIKKAPALSHFGETSRKGTTFSKGREDFRISGWTIWEYITFPNNGCFHLRLILK